MNLVEAVYNDLLQLKTANKLNSLEMPKQIFLLLDPFSVDNDCLTPTAKLKRNIAKIKFKPEIEKMYQAGALNFKKSA